MKCKFLIGIASVMLLGSCNNYLDLVPEKDIETLESIFERKEQVEKWMLTAYIGVQRLSWCTVNPAYVGTDEFVGGYFIHGTDPGVSYTYFPGFHIADGLQMSQEPLANIWDNDLYVYIRHCNTFFQYIDHVYNLSAEGKAQWTAEMKAMKAFCYFELIRRYGPIALVPDNIGVNATLEEMRIPRSHVDTCFKATVKLLDEAAAVLVPNAEKEYYHRAYFSLEAALALKAKVLLYQASPLFNGNEYYINFKDKAGKPMFSTTYDNERWRLAAEAADVAVAACERNQRLLQQGGSNQSTPLLNTMDDIELSVLAEGSGFLDQEILFGIVPGNSFGYLWHYTLPKTTTTAINNDGVFGCLAPTIKMVEMYYTKNGLPISMDKEWDFTSRYQLSKELDRAYTNVVSLTDNVLGLHLQREPRFYANIAFDRGHWQRGTVVYQVNAYKGEQFGSQYSTIQQAAEQNIGGYWCKKGSYSTIPTEKYLPGGDQLIPIIRTAEVYLMQAEAWNEYEGPQQNRAHVYDPLNKIRARAGIPDVETSWRSYSVAPTKVDTKEGMREIIRQEYNIELAFEGHRFWNLRRWKTAHTELNEKLYGWNVLGETAQSFYNNFAGPVVVWEKHRFQAPRDYLFPLRAEEVMISGLVQNPYW